MPLVPHPLEPNLVRSAADDPRPGLLYLAPWVDLGGSDKGTIDWFRKLDRSRWRLSLITTQPSPNRWLHQVEPYADEVWNLPELMPGWEMPHFILSFVASRRIRLLHIMNSRLAFDLLPDLSVLPEPPATVVQFHAEEPDRSGYVRYVSTRYGNLVDAFSVTSNWLAEAVAEYDVPPSRIEIITTGVDATGEFDPARVEPFDGLDGSDGTRILWPGRLAEQKDPLLTIEVVARLARRGLDFTVHFVGDGHLRADVDRHARALGVAHLLRFHPASQEMARWYRSTDVLLMTSVFEGIPYVIYEALAMGVPVVAPALPGNRELLDERSGALIDPRDDVDAYADALERLLTDADLRAAMGADARRRMLADCSLERMASEHERLYERLLSRPATIARPPDLEQPLTDTDQAVRTRLDLRRAPTPPREIAVVIPCYQHGRFLDECLRSLEAQSLPPAEILVVDDGSPDRETAGALDAVERAGRARVLRLERNLGPSAARNRAIAQVEAPYVLPLDADDRLLPNALRQLVEQLEAAPPEVAFVYPTLRHFGNREDLWQPPAWNLHMLLSHNYCASASLFDRRIFAGGIRYDEQIVFGHEDWDLILRIAAHGLRGEPSPEPVFLYRKRGFSRVNAAEFGVDELEEVVRRRHAGLYARRDAIKREWMPALSLLLPNRALLTALAPQSCGDFELLVPPGDESPGHDGVVVRTIGEAGAEPADWLAAAIPVARGRFVCVCGDDARPSLGRAELAELVIRSIGLDRAVPGLVLADVDGPPVPTFGPVPEEACADARPVAVAWSRLPRHPAEPPLAREAELGDEPLHDLILALCGRGPLHWRVQARATVPA